MYIIFNCFYQYIPLSDDLLIRNAIWISYDVKETLDHNIISPKWRLFCSGLNGKLFEIDLEDLSISNITDSYGGAIWCMDYDFHSQTIALGCEDGSIKLIDVAPNNLNFLKSFAKTESRIMSICWSTDGNTLYSGNNNGKIYSWDNNLGRINTTMSVYDKEGVIFWKLVDLHDGTYLFFFIFQN